MLLFFSYCSIVNSLERDEIETAVSTGEIETIHSAESNGNGIDTGIKTFIYLIIFFI